jgi:hypothetical protein
MNTTCGSKTADGASRRTAWIGPSSVVPAMGLITVAMGLNATALLRRPGCGSVEVASPDDDTSEGRGARRNDRGVRGPQRKKRSNALGFHDLDLCSTELPIGRGCGISNLHRGPLSDHRRPSCRSSTPRGEVPAVATTDGNMGLDVLVAAAGFAHARPTSPAPEVCQDRSDGGRRWHTPHTARKPQVGPDVDSKGRPSHFARADLCTTSTNKDCQAPRSIGVITRASVSRRGVRPT